MKTQRAKKSNAHRRGDMRRFSALIQLYNACLSNAEDLLEDALILFKRKRFARAFALAYTGWEEVGKAQLSADYAYDMAAEDEFEAAFSDHKIKSAYNCRRFVFNTKDISDSTIEYDRNHANDDFDTRMASLYVDKTSDLEPILPKDKVSKRRAWDIISDLGQKLDEIRNLDAMTERMGSKSFLK